MPPVGQIKNQILLQKIGKRIKSIREGKGVTQEAFIFDTNIHIGRIETAKVNITISTLDAICKYFDTDLQAFFLEIGE